MIFINDFRDFGVLASYFSRAGHWGPGGLDAAKSEPTLAADGEVGIGMRACSLTGVNHTKGRNRHHLSLAGDGHAVRLSCRIGGDAAHHQGCGWRQGDMRSLS